jgi:hypothetical protein
VGIGVGASVGAAVGNGAGTLVGVSVGCKVGATDGVRVLLFGAAVATAQSSRPLELPEPTAWSLRKALVTTKQPLGAAELVTMPR